MFCRNDTNNIKLISAVGVNFALWGLVVVPAWFVVRRIGVLYLGPEEVAIASVDEAMDSKQDSS